LNEMKNLLLLFLLFVGLVGFGQTNITASGFSSVGYYNLLNPNGTYYSAGIYNGKNSYSTTIYYNANGSSCSGNMYIRWNSDNSRWEFNFSVNGNDYFCNYVNFSSAYHTNATDLGTSPPCTGWTGNGSLSGGCASATPPDPPVIASSQTVCAGVGVNLTATGCSGGTINWSDGGTGASRTNVVFNATISSLTATCTVGNLTSGNSNAITITVNPKPTLVITNPAAVAPPATVDMTAPAVTAGSTLPSGTTLSYHTDAAGMVALTMPPPSAVNASGTYYIKAATAFCSDIKPVVVVVQIPCPTSLTIASPNYTTEALTREASATAGALTATNQVTNTAQIIYQAKSVTLSPGFQAQPSATGAFRAQVGGCD
jgi:hypothetical protein